MDDHRSLLVIAIMAEERQKFGLQSQELAQLKMQEGCSNQILPQNVTIVQGTEIALAVLSGFISSYYFIQENM